MNVIHVKTTETREFPWKQQPNKEEEKEEVQFLRKSRRHGVNEDNMRLHVHMCYSGSTAFEPKAG